MAGKAVEPGRTVTSKVTAILMAFTSGSDWSLSELARLTGIPLTTTHRLVSELTAARMLERAPGARYRVGPALGQLQSAAGAAPAAPTVAALAPAVLDDLAAATGRTVRLGVLRGTRVAYVEKAGRAAVTSFGAGATLPAHASAMGKVLLAFAPPATARSTVARGLAHYTERTITRRAQLLHELSVTRLTGFATCHGELLPDESTVAAPVTAAGGRVVAALEARAADLRPGPHGGLDVARHLLTVAARGLSRELSAAATSTPPVGAAS
jgi:DNA-binding IclR family transcriptional regulator